MTATYIGGVFLEGMTADTLLKDQERMLKALVNDVQRGCKDLEGKLGPDYDVRQISWTPVHTSLSSVYLLLTIVGKSKPEAEPM